MRNRPLAFLTLAGIALAMNGCGISEPSELLGDFDWLELEGVEATETSDIAVLGGNMVIFVGEFSTPTACYKLVPEARSKGATATLTIAARLMKSSTCAERAGAYRYQGSMQVRGDARELKVIHKVEDGESTEHLHPFDELDEEES